MQAPRTKWWLLVAVGVVLVAVVTIFKMADSVRESDTVVRHDQQILDFMVNHRAPFLTDVAKVVTNLGSGWFIAPIVIFAVAALLYAHRRRAALILALSNIGAVALVAVLKDEVGRSRPPVATQLVAAHGPAFPSGHSAQAVAFYGSLAWLAWELGRPRRTRVWVCCAAATIAFAVGLSRVYLGVHWPSDVLSGWLLGIGWLTALVGLSSARRRAPAPDPA
jgi:membrane-associated phospholipid phosphatase